MENHLQYIMLIFYLHRLLPKTVQILLFSATFSEQVAQFARAFVPEPLVTITLEREKLSVDKIKQYYIDCKSEANKFTILSEVYGYLSVGQSIIFVHVCDSTSCRLSLSTPSSE